MTRIATQGSAGSDFPFYVESFQLKYSNTSIDWRDYSEHGQTKVTINLLRVKSTSTVSHGNFEMKFLPVALWIKSLDSVTIQMTNPIPRARDFFLRRFHLGKIVHTLNVASP